MRLSKRNYIQLKLQALLCLVVICPAVRSQTSIVAARGPNEVVIGADSKRKISEFEPSGRLVGVSSALVCKIQKANGFYFGCSGPCGEVDVASIIVRASRQPGSIQRKVEILVPLVEDALNDFLSNKSPNALQRYANSPTALQLLFVGIQDQVPLILGVDFHYRKSNSSITVQAGETLICASERDGCNYLAIGRTDAIANFTKKQGSMDALARVPRVVGVERLIQMEIDDEPDDVGPPIDILRITRRGVQWIKRKPQCERGTTSHKIPALHGERGRPARLERRKVRLSGKSSTSAFGSRYALIAGGTPAVPVKSLDLVRGGILHATAVCVLAQIRYSCTLNFLRLDANARPYV